MNLEKLILDLGIGFERLCKCEVMVTVGGETKNWKYLALDVYKNHYFGITPTEVMMKLDVGVKAHRLKFKNEYDQKGNRVT